jgi:hypothetical protein
MIYYDVHENDLVLWAFRKAIKHDPALDQIDDQDYVALIQALEKSNNMKIHGILHIEGYIWETTGFAFSNEKSLAWFLLRWS